MYAFCARAEMHMRIKQHHVCWPATTNRNRCVLPGQPRRTIIIKRLAAHWIWTNIPKNRIAHTHNLSCSGTPKIWSKHNKNICARPAYVSNNNARWGEESTHHGTLNCVHNRAHVRLCSLAVLEKWWCDFNECGYIAFCWPAISGQHQHTHTNTYTDGNLWVSHQSAHKARCWCVILSCAVRLRVQSACMLFFVCGVFACFIMPFFFIEFI